MKIKNTKRVTLSLLEKLEACESGVEYWESLPEDHREDPLWLMQHAIDSDNLHVMEYANWLLVRLFSTKNAQRYAVFAARQVLHLFEEKYPDDDRPRKAIDAAEAVIKRNTAENREKSRLAGWAAHTAWNATWAAHTAARAAAACTVSDDASDRAAALAARAAADAVDAADAAAAADAADDGKKMRIEILEYGMELLKKCLTKHRKNS